MLNDFSSEVLGGVYEKARNICMKMYEEKGGQPKRSTDNGS